MTFNTDKIYLSNSIKEIRVQMSGTTVVQKLNQGLPRPLGGIKRPAPFLGTLAPVRRETGGGEQKGTKAYYFIQIAPIPVSKNFLFNAGISLSIIFRPFCLSPSHLVFSSFIRSITGWVIMATSFSVWFIINR